MENNPHLFGIFFDGVLLRYFGVIIMRMRLLELLASLVICILFPLILFSIMTLFLQQKNSELSYESADYTYSVTDSVYSNVLVKMADGSVENMPLEEYILSVVLREMPADFHIDALKAQAVVARTYTVRHMNNTVRHKSAHVCVDSSCCQGFRSPEDFMKEGGSSDNLATVKKAVKDTRGEILIYDGLPIEATYFSCSGGTTEDAVAVWGSDVPYLRSTNSPGEEQAKHYTDTVHLTVAEVTNKLGIELKDYHEFRIGNVSYTAGGGVNEAIICGQKIKGTEMRKKLGLKSTAFVINVAGDTVAITTRGYGHRVGMSQYGAEAMAVKGSTYQQILYHYYHGVEVVSLSDIY